MSRRFTATFTAAATADTTQLNCIRRARPTATTTTTKAEKITTANARGPTTLDELENAGAAIQSTIQGESSARPVATQVVTSTT